MTDVWTSAGVIVGVGAVALTGVERLDPVVALIVAANIIWSGYTLVKRSVTGLMDKALTSKEQESIQNVLEPYRKDGVDFHAILTRQAGAKQFVSFHVLVPGTWTVQKGHQLLETIEKDIRKVFPNIIITTHLEPIEDQNSYKDITLEREY